MIAGSVILGLGLSLSGAAVAQAATACAPDSGANFAGMTPTIAQLSKASLRCADFRGANLSKLSFEQADLSGSDFRHATIVNSDFTQATLTGATFADATLTDTSFEQASMGGVTLTGIHAAGADFEQVTLNGVSLAGAGLQDAELSQASLKGANLSNADLGGASLDETDLTGANLAEANLSGADLSGATTTNTDVSNITGLPPLDLFAAIIALVVGLLVLRPRLARRGPGRVGAWLVVLILAALTVIQAMAARGWQPTSDALFVLPLLTPVIFIAIFVARGIRRPRDGWAAAVLALIGLVGFYLVTASGLAFVGDNLFGLFPFSDTCSSVACGYGIARGPLGIGIGVVLILVCSVLSRAKSLAKPAPNLARWAAMQADGLVGAGVGTVYPSAAAPTGTSGTSPGQDYGPPPPNQTI